MYNKIENIHNFSVHARIFNVEISVVQSGWLKWLED